MKGDRPNPRSLQSFRVEGLAAFAEYVKFRPAALRGVRATKPVRADVERLIRDANLRLGVDELKPDQRRDAEAPVEALVEIQALDVETFERRIASRSRDLILACDHITDPRNLGAIVRSAAFFGISEVLAPERRQVLLTQAAVATAQGGFALADLVVVVNLARTLRALKDQGYWIIGADMNGEHYDALAGEYEKTVLVLGSEDSGLSRNVRELCDRIASIPRQGKGLDSLNVSVAAGIMLSAFSRKHAPGP